ncbi:hypothetical protein AGOR_G00171940 [Albula goreensis]|uniref:Uncharacterized protein n=1 Tax=Albula goreensis TaxID=1534307 RepID=A0A8T3CYC9_9TELE|nr:hypothetical protein AGOR_G00171940 [Albula goreensis]
MKRCSAAAPSQEAKRQRVSPPATQSGAGEHPLNAVSTSIPTIGVADDRPPDSVSTAAQTSVLHPVPVSTTAQTNILLSAPDSTSAQTSVLQLAPICTTAQTSVFSTAPQTSVLHSTPVSSTAQMSILHPPPVSTATQTSVLNPGPASSAAQTSALKISPVSAATQTAVLRPPPVSTAAKTSARHSVPVSIAPKASVLHLAPVPAAIHAAVLRPSPVPAAIHASVLQPLPVSVASQTGIIHSAPVSTTPQTSLLHTTPVSIAPKTSLLPSSPVPGSIQGKQTKVIVRTPSSLMTRIITGPLEKVVDNLVRGRYRYLVKSIMSVPDLYNVMVNEVLQRVEKECKQLTSLKFNSILRQITPMALNEFKWNKALAEWRTAAPTFLKFLACASTASVEMRASDTRGPTRRKTCAMAMAGATLLKARAAGMCAPMYRNSLVLSHSGARKRCFDQFSKLSICVSHVSTLKKLKEMGGLSRESHPPHRKITMAKCSPHLSVRQRDRTHKAWPRTVLLPAMRITLQRDRTK